MRKSRAVKPKKVQAEPIVENAWEGWVEQPAQSVAEPQPWEIAATAFVPFMEANDTHQDAWLLFQAYHLSEQTRLLQAILTAVSIN